MARSTSRGGADQLHEYEIATEVFGRSKTTFDAGEDAIARVEAHRLRKRLKEFYENDGKSHAIQVTLPSGTYVPVFTHRGGQAPGVDADQAEDSGPQDGDSSATPGHGDPADRGSDGEGGLRSFARRWRWPHSVLAAALVLSAVGLYWVIHRAAAASQGSGEADSAHAPAPASPPPVPSGTVSLPVRIMAGYTGKAQVDSAGAVWEPDHYFQNGGTWTLPGNFIARTSDPMLFEHWRTGDFFYDIPLPPGMYELHLYFVTVDRSTDAISTFSVSINSERVLTGFDVNSDALGENTADERIFRDVSPSKDGYLHLAFTSERGAPALNALEILPGNPHKQLPIRLVTQLTSFTDQNGQFWHPDNYSMNGRLSAQRQQIAGSSDPDLFGAERYGHFTYAIPVDTRDKYRVVLHFAEFYFGPHASGVGGVGSRIFRVLCNGGTLLGDFDIFKEAGSLHALTKTFYHLKPTAQGKLNLTFEPIANNATISGIEVLDESQ